MRELAVQLEQRAASDPDGLAVIDASGEHTWGEIVATARELAAAMEDSLQGAPTVLLQADNTWRTLAAVVAVGMRGGLVAVVSRHATSGECRLALEDVRPDAVVASVETVEHWALVDAEFPAACPVLHGWTLRSRPGRTGGVERWEGGVAIAMTSGSTGRPKCVVQSESALRYAGAATIDAVGLLPGDPVAALVPLSSVAALCFGLYLPAMLGGPQVCLDGWKPEAAVEVMERHQVAWTMLVPTMALQLSLVPGSDGTLRAMRAMTVGGGPMSAAALERAERSLGTRFLRVFGMSECLGHTTSLPSDDVATRLGSDGRPFPGTEVRIAGPDGRPVAGAEVGHAQVRGPSLFVGYARDGRPQPPALTGDGFLTTGDLARVNADGTLNILGREKQIIIRGGRNIDINEVEAAVAALPDIAQVCVVPVPDEMLGERAAALVVAGTRQTLDDVRAGLDAAGVPKFKWPEFVIQVSDLPQNRVGKLNRSEAISLARRLTGAPTPPDEESP
ncbi:class I adenylate-forming enzyme family protein [Nocardioides plantarum]|uniref:Class I adenylate-forming enzyme family protein n=1 Tax=Nocardioides plantarum TaxID=29299 RepID=A0ABV5KEU3_9ACTN|nr:class I adenylate-forming enzyme family protein [Nocardioides plantarum]